MKKFQPSPALVISLIALFVALGGTSYAAINALPKNSVGTKQLKNGAVTPGKIKGAAPVWHKIGGAGEPAFQNGWTNESPGDEVTAAFYKDPFGVVHLKGIVTGGSNGTIFTLPARYRPSRNLVEPMWRFASGSGEMAIYSIGIVNIVSGSGVASLDGVSFTAGE
jgi:hypothetical protein